MINRIQKLRKSTGLLVSDNIAIFIGVKGDNLTNSW